MSFPGSLSRIQFATGLLIRSVKINGSYLLVDNCTINQTQEIDMNKMYIQGGPGRAIANIGAKKFTGELSFPIRVDRDNILEPAVKKILEHAENPMYSLTLDTNHMLSHLGLTAESGATDNNALLTLDQMVLKSLTISASSDDALKVSASFEGMIDVRTDSDYAVPDENHVMGRSLTWGDCDVNRYQSSMRSVSNFTLQINNEIETPSFLLPYEVAGTTRSDQVALIGVKEVKWTGEFSEFLRVGAELDTHIHGGWMVNENLQFNMGPITATYAVPLFEIAELPLTSKILTRKTKWNAMISPAQPMRKGGLFTFQE
jgi:hypothetical protein